MHSRTNVVSVLHLPVTVSVVAGLVHSTANVVKGQTQAVVLSVIVVKAVLLHLPATVASVVAVTSTVTVNAHHVVMTPLRLHHVVASVMHNI
jgi:hypothetical protein